MNAHDLLVLMLLFPPLIFISWLIFLTFTRKERAVFIVCIELHHFWNVTKVSKVISIFNPLGGVILRNSCELFFGKGKDAINFVKLISNSALEEKIHYGVGISFGQVRRQWFVDSQFFPLSFLLSDDKDIAVQIAKAALGANAIYADSSAQGLLAFQLPPNSFSDSFELPVDDFCIYRGIYQLYLS